MHDIVRPSVLEKVYAGMLRLTCFYRVCFPRKKMACHDKRCLTMCVVYGPLCHATPDIARPCVHPKGDDSMS